jgi:hypothetical protein
MATGERDGTEVRFGRISPEDAAKKSIEEIKSRPS